jgi:hypothetical protein
LGPVLHDCLRISCVASGRWAGRARPRPLPFIRAGAYRVGDWTLRIDKINSLTEWMRPPALGPKQVSWEYAAEGTWRTREHGGHPFELGVSAIVAWTGEHDPTAATTRVRLGGVVREGEVVVDHDLITLQGTVTVAGAQVGSVVQDPATGGSNITFTACGGNQDEAVSAESTAFLCGHVRDVLRYRARRGRVGGSSVAPALLSSAGQPAHLPWFVPQFVRGLQCLVRPARVGCARALARARQGHDGRESGAILAC